MQHGSDASQNMGGAKGTRVPAYAKAEVSSTIIAATRKARAGAGLAAACMPVTGEGDFLTTTTGLELVSWLTTTGESVTAGTVLVTVLAVAVAVAGLGEAGGADEEVVVGDESSGVEEDEAAAVAVGAGSAAGVGSEEAAGVAEGPSGVAVDAAAAVAVGVGSGADLGSEAAAVVVAGPSGVEVDAAAAVAVGVGSLATGSEAAALVAAPAVAGCAALVAAPVPALVDLDSTHPIKRQHGHLVRIMQAGSPLRHACTVLCRVQA